MIFAIFAKRGILFRLHHMKRTTALLSLLSCIVLTAQPTVKNGGISAEMLRRISASYEASPSDKAVKNALAGTSIATLAVNSGNAAMMDTHFSDRVASKGITDQKSSGRCWLFTGLNVLRAQMMTQHNLPEFTLSQGYVFFYDQLEKANLFLQSVIDTRDKAIDDREVDWLFRNPISDGGTFTGVANLVTKYGCVPSEAFTETFSANSTSQMRQILSLKLREDGLRLREARQKDLPGMKEQMLGEIYRILVLCLGQPPVSFEWTRCDKAGEIVDTRSYTPVQFYNEYIGNDLENGYVMLMNDPCRAYHKVYEIQYDRHTYEGQNWKYLNLPIDEFKQIAIASIKAGKAMYISCDVSKFLSKSKGTLDLDNMDYTSLFGVDFGMDKKERILTHASGSSHAMTLVAVDLKDGKPLKWMVENSWGRDYGYKGHLIMTDEWFENYMFRIVAEKQFVPEALLRELDQKPILLPAWDPMFSQDE